MTRVAIVAPTEKLGASIAAALRSSVEFEIVGVANSSAEVPPGTELVLIARPAALRTPPDGRLEPAPYRAVLQRSNWRRRQSRIPRSIAALPRSMRPVSQSVRRWQRASSARVAVRLLAGRARARRTA